ncbi:hypothetical protein [Nannocystis pusilla]|uniref:hypothetical protein n=1 Tax=Nannocystis pusilla TaxID=889268 RepID=UPI003DA643AB
MTGRSERQLALQHRRVVAAEDRDAPLIDVVELLDAEGLTGGVVLLVRAVPGAEDLRGGRAAGGPVPRELERVGAAAVLAEVEPEAQRVDRVAVVHVEHADDVGRLAAVVAVAVVGDDAHAPVVRHAPELDVEAPAEADVAVRALDDDAVAAAVAHVGRRQLGAREQVDRRVGVVGEQRVGRAAEDEVVERVELGVHLDGVGDVQRRLDAHAHVGAGEPVAAAAAAAGLAGVDAEAGQAADAVHVAGARGLAEAADRLGRDRGRDEVRVLELRVVGVVGADRRLVALAVAEVEPVEVVGPHAHVAVQLEQLQLPQAAGLGRHRLDRLQRLLVLRRRFGRAFLLLLALAALARHAAAAHRAHAAHASSAHAHAAAHGGLRVRGGRASEQVDEAEGRDQPEKAVWPRGRRGRHRRGAGR